MKRNYQAWLERDDTDVQYRSISENRRLNSKDAHFWTSYYWVITMKATELERKRFDKSLDEIIDLFNNIESDEPIIRFSDEVLINIEKAKKKYGDDMVDEKINKVVHEMLSWLDLDDVELEEEEGGKLEE